MSNERNFDSPLILAVDTATAARSVGLFRGAEQIVLQVCGQTPGGSSTVLGEIDRVLRAATVGVSAVELFALAIGPGSFTGLRAGLATVKALATTLRKPAHGVQTLHAVAHAAGTLEGVIVSLIPAGRGEVFAQRLSLREDGAVVEHEPPTHAAPAELIESIKALGGRVTWAGEGALKYRELIEEAARAEGLKLVEGDEKVDEGVRAWTLAPCVGGLAQDVAALAYSRYDPAGNYASENLRALYVRPADAKLAGA